MSDLCMEQQEMAATGGIDKNKKEMHLVITNISKRANIRSLLLTAAAFDVASVFVVGQRSFDFSPDSPDLPRQLRDSLEKKNGDTSTNMNITRFDKWQDFMDFKTQQNILLVGVEIHQEAKDIEDYSSCEQSIAFLMGNEGQGLNTKHMNSCDGFVRIPQYGGGTASLNVNVAASIILHRYHHILLSEKDDFPQNKSSTLVPSP